jgi:hypothetical protein
MLLQLLLIYVALSMVILWLPINRGLIEGSDYRWSVGEDIGGRGVGGEYWLLLVLFALGFAVLYLGWRGARPPFQWLLPLWMALLLAQPGSAALAGEEGGFEGETFGIQISLPWPLIAALDFSALALVWLVRDRRSARRLVRPVWGPHTGGWGWRSWRSSPSRRSYCGRAPRAASPTRLASSSPSHSGG